MGMDEIHEYLRIAEDAADKARRMFTEGLGAAPALHKGGGDYATEIDLQIESMLREQLAYTTGISVLGEEEGGVLRSDASWVVDPIDGTANFASGNPNCAVLISLVVDNQPVLSVTDIPLLDMRLTAREGSHVWLNDRQLPRLTDTPIVSNQVGVGAVGSDDTNRIPPDSRLRLVKELERTNMRPRISGSVGIDLAFVAQGIYEAAVSFSPHPWDNAAGVLLTRCAGAVVTDIDGQPWTLDSIGVIAGSPGAHERVLSTIKSIQ
ncbi:inositol monophosphatase family protein [Corynebacterium genitalium]|uniref:Inositol monophosphatase family protein n=1 Tax=Corynebacterium genitalium ATCC 33030 TaxID=585529 RepID=D7WEX4_9CORY|nr:inositol monophosphatase family protein [Corynebacterium genitalium ATCC 33030]